MKKGLVGAVMITLGLGVTAAIANKSIDKELNETDFKEQPIKKGLKIMGKKAAVVATEIMAITMGLAVIITAVAKDDDEDFNEELEEEKVETIEE